MLTGLRRNPTFQRVALPKTIRPPLISQYREGELEVARWRRTARNAGYQRGFEDDKAWPFGVNCVSVMVVKFVTFDVTNFGN